MRVCRSDLTATPLEWLAGVTIPYFRLVNCYNYPDDIQIYIYIYAYIYIYIYIYLVHMS